MIGRVPDNPLIRFLATNPADVGCGETLELLDVYVDLLVDGAHARGRYPGILAHLEDCPPCAEDFAGLLARVRADHEGRS